MTAVAPMTTTPISRSAKGLMLRLTEIEIPPTARPYNAMTVVELSRSIAAIGLQSAPTVIERDGRFVLVAGRHRIEALKLLGVQSVLVRVVDFDDVEARLWTISENLHRSELTVLDRSENIAEWIRLTEEKRASAQFEPKSSSGGRNGGGRLEGGVNAASRDLGITRAEAQRSVKIAALPEETKQAARDLGYDGHQSALLKAAKAPTPDAQTAVLAGIKERGRVVEDTPPSPEPDDLPAGSRSRRRTIGRMSSVSWRPRLRLCVMNSRGEA